MSDFDKFLDILLEKLKDLLKEHWQDFFDAAKDAGEDFLNQTKEDLQRWTRLLANGDLTRDEFEFLVASKKDLFKLETLKQLGLSKVRLQMFQDAVINLVVETALDVFL